MAQLDIRNSPNKINVSIILLSIVQLLMNENKHRNTLCKDQRTVPSHRKK